MNPPTPPKCPPMAIGADVWPGLGKLAEECGELLQVIGKLVAYPDGEHPDSGPALAERLSEEIADLQAALHFTVEVNDLDRVAIRQRASSKITRFRGWHEKERLPLEGLGGDPHTGNT